MVEKATDTNWSIKFSHYTDGMIFNLQLDCFVCSLFFTAVECRTVLSAVYIALTTYKLKGEVISLSENSHGEVEDNREKWGDVNCD